MLLDFLKITITPRKLFSPPVSYLSVFLMNKKQTTTWAAGPEHETLWSVGTLPLTLVSPAGINPMHTWFRVLFTPHHWICWHLLKCCTNLKHWFLSVPKSASVSICNDLITNLLSEEFCVGDGILPLCYSSSHFLNWTVTTSVQ